MFRRKRRTPWIKKVLIALMIGCLLLCAGAYFIAERLRPMICPIAVAEAKSIATMSINTAVNQELSVAEIGYDDLITLEMDAENRVTALKANTLEINKLRASLTVAIQSKVDQIQDSIVEIPLGTVVNNELLSGVGPNIRIQLAPVGFVETDITNSFSAAGINQTRHQVILSVSATIAIVMRDGICAGGDVDCAGRVGAGRQGSAELHEYRVVGGCGEMGSAHQLSGPYRFLL